MDIAEASGQMPMKTLTGLCCTGFIAGPGSVQPAVCIFCFDADQPSFLVKC
jgi:hypothetical protein